MFNIIHEALILKVQQAINSSLQELMSLNPEILSKLNNLNNKTISVNINAFPLDLNYSIEILNNKMEIKPDKNLNADLKVKLTPGSMIRAKLLGIDRVLRSRDIELTGDLSLAMELQGLISDIDLNFKELLQEKLTQLTSDHFAWQMINILDKVADRIKIKSAELNEQVADYLHTEKNIVVSKTELEYFYQDVDQLQNDFARLSARFTRLSKNHIFKTET